MTRSSPLNAFVAGFCTAGAIGLAIIHMWPLAALTAFFAVANLGAVAFPNIAEPRS